MISVVVPNFNSGDRLVKNLPKLLELLKKSSLEFEVIVVDDASTDDSVQLIETTFARGGLAKVVTKPTNTGFGMTVDKGIRAAKGEIIFVLNAIDILPESSEYFKIMLEHFKDPKTFSVAAVKRDEEDHGCGRIYFEKGFFLHQKGVIPGLKKLSSQRTLGSIHIDPGSPPGMTSAWADGGSQGLRKEYYLKIGGFDPLYKLYWEDVDLGYRAWKAGYQVDFEPKAILLHKKIEGPIAKFYNERQRRVMNLRNQFIFTWKNSDAKHLIFHFSFFIFHLLIAVKNGDGDWFRALFQAKLQIFNILMARWRQKKLIKLSDDKILAIFSK